MHLDNKDLTRCQCMKHEKHIKLCLRTLIFALLMTGPAVVFSAATEARDREISEPFQTYLSMFREGLTDRDGNLIDPKGATQAVGPIALEHQPLKDAHERSDRAKKIYEAENEKLKSAPMAVSFRLEKQHFHLAHRLPEQVGSIFGVEFGQSGPSMPDQLSQYGEMSETFSLDPHQAPAGPARNYTTGRIAKVHRVRNEDNSHLILRPIKGDVENPHYGVQLKAFTHFLAGKPAGSHEMAELVVRFNNPVNDPIFHIAELGGFLPSGGLSLELDLLKANSISKARFEKLSGNGERFEVSDQALSNLTQNLDCHQPLGHAGGGCGSLMVRGEGITEVRLGLKLNSAHAIPEHEKDNLEGGDRIAISVTIPAVGAALASGGPVGAAIPVSSPIPRNGVAWTGAYIGVTAGAIFNQSNVTAQNFGLVSDPCKSSGSNTSFLPGALAGYLHQFENDVVVGAEADFTYPWGNMGSECLCSNGAYDRFKTSNKAQGSIRARLGYAVPYDLLPYITAGVTFASQSLGYSNEFGDRYSKSATQTGWVVGAGLEYGFLNGLSVRGEYLYSSYGNSLGMDLPSINGAFDPTGQASANVNSNVVRAALNYRF